MSNRNKKMRGFYGEASDINDVVNNWFTPEESTSETQYYQTDVIDNSWILQEQIDNERIARELAQAEADRIAAEQAYQAYLVELQAEIRRQEAIEAQRQAEAIALAIAEEEERDLIRRTNARLLAEAAELEAIRIRDAEIAAAVEAERVRQAEIAAAIVAQRELEAIELAIAEEEERDLIRRKNARLLAEAAELEVIRVRDAEIAAAVEAEALRVRQAIAVAAAEAEALRLVAEKKAADAEAERIKQEKIAAQAEVDRIAAEKAEAVKKAAQAEADRIAAEEKAAQAEADRLEAIRVQILADAVKDDELRKYKVAQEEADDIKEETRILALNKAENARKLVAINDAKKSYEESIKLLKAQNELTIAMQKSFLDTIINF